MVNSCWSKLDTVSGPTRDWICYNLDIVCIYVQCLDLPESGFAVLWILLVSGYSVWIYQESGFTVF